MARHARRQWDRSHRRLRIGGVAAIAAIAVITYVVGMHGAAMASGLDARGTIVRYLPLGLVGIVSWIVWGTRWVSSRSYAPTVSAYRATTSVVVPCYREDPATVERCLRSWLAEAPDEVVIVPDLADSAVIAMLALTFGDDPRVRVVPFQHAGKRSALGVGIRAARFDIVVLTDSDTAWEPGLLAAVQMPFDDPTVGGVGTRQSAFRRRASIWRLIADWQVGVRYLDYVPAESRAGGVTCLSGRTAAYRRSAVLPLLPDLEHEVFLGRQCVAGDDGRLTWLVLSSGYRTVYQSSARAVSMFPTTGRAYIKQRIRWSRNSYRCYLTAVTKGWLARAPLATQVRVAQILATPLTQGLTLAYLLWSLTQGFYVLAVAGAAWLFISRLLRSVSYLMENPRELWVLPVVTLAIIVVALPIKLYAFATMNVQGWLTRGEHSRGGEGQSEATNWAFAS